MTSDLASSLWHDTCREQILAPQLTEEVTADLVVIGGGYTGCAAALKAAGLGADVRLIEAGSFGSGGSGRNVGLANAGLWLPPEDINAEIGEAAGRRLSDLLAGAPDMVYDLIETHQIACEPVRKGTLHCAHAPSGMKDLQRRFDQLSRIGAPVKLLDASEAQARVGSEQVFGALFDPRAGTIQPLAYARGLARATAGAGAKVHAETPALSATRQQDIWDITTPNGRIRAKHMIVATNGYALPIEGLKTPAMIPVHYFQAATDPLPDSVRRAILPELEGCWDSALVMSSWRLDQEGRLIIGGMGALNHSGSGIHLGWLRRKLADLFPALANTPLRQTWFGRIAMTTEHLPKIQHLDGGYACFGYSGRGICPGTLFGTRMAEALLTGETSCLPVDPVASHSLPFAGLKQAYYETGATLTHLVKNRF
ncbi:NAD(P)/FAD-dependent oxidoreductase [Phaeobacter gallaeciensis]|uniref:NAD(P)/FAD-dependent oxidoreductase n=1 Tax=Phaeobacter gallaeciensis TaxID=60890 RepID=UPI00237F11A2|nr:FAD-binding oxidoreductase [Phaeobacter gallaeciensis]MDE4097206.1 FAD-binding oxidoreductase [Phaeobacter gallaeciensis]MDE4106280.1 FAD-binding oxidoreductase [Phaeobacter gallaeciensis]MDE4112878.1 FAD-binding oxidoreductase [Phaeobacter gallaeciensis]MDE4114941.1 FAD-binding oxidoreductase [Phaeobacter gallaeciensis]MDE4119409.1 FAD-binding oxidoreductase [Phaeobacter gallaeciensis]